MSNISILKTIEYFPNIYFSFVIFDIYIYLYLDLGLGLIAIICFISAYGILECRYHPFLPLKDIFYLLLI